jgi:anti-sigma B factor antagonist
VEIIKNVIDDVCEIKLVGRLDTTTAPELETALKEVLEASTKNLQIDLEQLDYISSAGLRVLLFAQKGISSLEGEMLIKNVKPEIMEVFEITGFSDILTIEK